MKSVIDKPPHPLKMIVFRLWVWIGYYILPHSLYIAIVNCDEWYDCYYRHTKNHKTEMNRIKDRVCNTRKSIIG